MLLPENRLKKIRDFNLLMKHGQWVSGRLFDLKWLKLAENRDLFPKKEDPKEFVAQLKVAFGVGLKISKSAVKRNHLRRQAREATRLLIKEKRLKTGYYLLFAAKKEALKAEYADLAKEIANLLRQARVLV